MRIGQVSHRWFLGGALAAIGLLLIGWVTLINPEHGRADAVRVQADAAAARLPSLKRRLAELQQENADKAQYLAQLESQRQALPSSAGLADFLRELQSAGDSRGVAVTSVQVANAKQVSAGGGTYYALPLSLDAKGSPDALGSFVDQLQQVQPRAVLITDASLNTGAEDHQTPKLTLTLQVFVSGTATTPTATPSASRSG